MPQTKPAKYIAEETNLQYFFIVGNVASILAFAAYLVDRFVGDSSDSLPSLFLFLFVILTLSFWIWFYMRPDNAIRKKIEGKSDYSGRYRRGQGYLDVVEGSLLVGTDTWGTTVSLPPFGETPELSIIPTFRQGRKNGIEIVEVTKDSFTVRIRSSDQSGSWRWRARGTLLKLTDK